VTLPIARVEFIGFTVLGPSWRSMAHYKPHEWSRWTVTLEGPYVALEGEGRKIEVPRARCIVHYGEEPQRQGAIKAKPPKPPVTPTPVVVEGNAVTGVSKASITVAKDKRI
jgi:hypothetical protein